MSPMRQGSLQNNFRSMHHMEKIRRDSKSQSGGRKFNSYIFERGNKLGPKMNALKVIKNGIKMKKEL